MDITLRVNRVSTHHVERKVTHEGADAVAMMPELQVELHDETGHHGSLTLHFFAQARIEEAKTVFVPGGMVTATFAAVAPAVAVDTNVSDQGLPTEAPAA